ncbi:7115_t:CDS:2 [Scutellospora calospora]|uniref:7115_t:CDS:1 n=1 Tax=Scutellospora calospora TaxID=85575 RepID=A0ACA9KH36_9GLOM|nr:7115_t:CDS:2 [Scutellospora calospora]
MDLESQNNLSGNKIRSNEDFEQLHCLPDPIPEDDLYYKSFEELYSMRTTENHRPSLINSKTKMNYDKTKTKHTMPFCPSAAHAKNVRVIVNCTEYEKPHFLFSSKKLSEKDIILLQRFLDTVFYTCGMSFYGTCDLTMIIPLEQSDVHDNSEDVGSDNEADDQENPTQENKNNESEPESSDDDDSNEVIEELNDNTEEASINKLFLRVFVNDSLSCASKIKKPYYSAGIYPNVCVECGSQEVSKLAKNEYPYCSDCGSNSGSSNLKKYSKQNKSSKNK